MDEETSWRSRDGSSSAECWLGTWMLQISFVVLICVTVAGICGSERRPALLLRLNCKFGFTQVGDQFVSKYYDVLEKLPKYVHRFYKENSTLTVADVQPDGRTVIETASGDLEVSTCIDNGGKSRPSPDQPPILLALGSPCRPSRRRS